MWKSSNLSCKSLSRKVYDIMAKLYFSSAQVLGKSSYAYVLIGRKYFRGRGIFHGPRLMAEYEALNEGLSLALNKDIRKVIILGPRLVICQLTEMHLLNHARPYRFTMKLRYYYNILEKLSSFQPPIKRIERFHWLWSC